MNFEIKKLTAELLDDWLYFFDHVAFCDDGDWSGCYCMMYHWTKELAKKKAWDCSVGDAPYNRKCAINCIENGVMQGYLAYLNGNVVGWCNANVKQAYENVNVDLSADPEARVKRIKSVVCFCIAPIYRGQGIATRLLEQVCKDAAEDGYDFVEAYPFENDGNKAYTGPRAMFEKQDFTTVDEVSGVTVMRKIL